MRFLYEDGGGWWDQYAELIFFGRQCLLQVLRDQWPKGMAWRGVGGIHPPLALGLSMCMDGTAPVVVRRVTCQTRPIAPAATLLVSSKPGAKSLKQPSPRPNKGLPLSPQIAPVVPALLPPPSACVSRNSVELGTISTAGSSEVLSDASSNLARARGSRLLDDGGLTRL